MPNYKPNLVQQSLAQANELAVSVGNRDACGFLPLDRPGWAVALALEITLFPLTRRRGLSDCLRTLLKNICGLNKILDNVHDVFKL